jgi:hypothetical protein
MRQQSNRNSTSYRLQVAADTLGIGHAHGLPAATVVGDGEDHRADVALCSSSRCSSAAMSMLPLKGCSSAVSLPSGMGDVDGRGAGELDVGAGGVEVRVADEDLARTRQVTVDDPLGRAALVGGQHVAMPVRSCTAGSMRSQEREPA